MNRIFTLLTYLTALLGAALHLRPVHRLAALSLWSLKLVAGALSPFLVLIGAVGAMQGLLRRNWKLAGAGVIGAGLARQYIQTVTREHNGFAEAFGPDWFYRIPPTLKPRLLPQRWTPVMNIPEHYAWQPNIVYGQNPETGEALVADLWQPRPGMPRTGLAVVYVHGGAWRLGKKDMGTRPFFKHLANQGHVVMDIEYTITPTTPLTVMVRDVKRALLWMKQYAGNYGASPERIVLMGGSAGGHLALLAGYTPNLPELQPEGRDEEDTAVHGVVAFYPPVDLRALYEQGVAIYGRLFDNDHLALADRVNIAGMSLIGMAPRNESGRYVPFLAHVVGGSPDDAPESYRLLSPSSHIGPHCPPTLLLQGLDDFFMVAPGVKRLHQSLRAVGVTSILVEYPHTEHAFDIILPRISPVAQSAIYEVERFLALLA